MFHCKCIQNRHNNTHWTTLSCNGGSCSTINYHSSAFNVHSGHSGLPSVGKLDKVAHQALSCRVFTCRYHCSNQSKISHKFTAGNALQAISRVQVILFSLPEMAQSDEQNVWVVFSLGSTELVIIMVSNTHFIK